MAGPVVGRFVYKLAADSAGFTKGVKRAGIALKGFATKSKRHFKAIDKASKKSADAEIKNLKNVDKQRDKNHKEEKKRRKGFDRDGVHWSQRGHKSFAARTASGPGMGGRVPISRHADPLMRRPSAAVRSGHAQRSLSAQRYLQSRGTLTGAGGSGGRIRDRLSGSGGGGSGVGAEEAAAGFDKAALKAKAAGLAFKGVGMALQFVKTALIGSLKAIADFQEQFQVVKAITSGTAEDFKNLEKSVIKVSTSTEHATGSLLKAAEVLGRAGFKAKDVGEALKTVADLATAGGMSAELAASLSVRMLKSFGKPMKELPKVANMLAHAAANANVSIQSLGEGFKFAGAIAQTSGISFSDVTTALSLLGETGLEAGLAGRALQAMLMDLQKPSNEAQQKLLELGIVTRDSLGMLPLETILRQFKEINVSSKDVFTIFNRNSARAVTALTRNVEKYKEFQKGVEGSTTALSEQSEVVRDSLNKNLAQLKNRMSAIGLSLGEDLLPPLMDFAEAILDLIAKLGDLHEATKWFTVFGFIGRLMDTFGYTKHQDSAKNRQATGASEDAAAISPFSPQNMFRGSSVNDFSGDTLATFGMTGNQSVPDREQKAQADRAALIANLKDPKRIIKEALDVIKDKFDAASMIGEIDSFNLQGLIKTTLGNLYEGLKSALAFKKDDGEQARKTATDALKGVLASTEVKGIADQIKDAKDRIAEQKDALARREKSEKDFWDAVKQQTALNKKAREDRIKANIKAMKARWDAWVNQNARLTAAGLALNEVAFKEIDTILESLPEGLKEEFEKFIEKGFDFGGSLSFGVGPNSTEDVIKKGKDFQKQAEVQGKIDSGEGILDVWDASNEIKDTWVSTLMKGKAVANDIAGAFETFGGEFGSIISSVIQGATSGGPVAAIGAGIMAVLSKSEAFTEFMDTAGEILGVLANALSPFVEVISAMVVPILKFAAKVIMATMTPLAFIWNMIAGFLNLFGANIQTIDIGGMWDSLNDGLDNLGDEVDDTADKFDDLNTSLTGIAGLPDAIKLNLIAFREAMNSTRAILTGRSSASPGHMDSPIRMHTGGVVPGSGNTDSVHALLTPGEQVIPAGQSAGDGTNVQIGTMIVKVTDVKDFVKKLNNQQEWRSMARSGSLYGKGVVGSR